MKQAAADDSKIPLLDLETTILNLTDSSTGLNVEYLKVIVTIHPRVLASVHIEKADVDRKGEIERPNMDAFGVNPGFDYPEGLFPSWFGDLHKDPTRGRQRHPWVDWYVGCRR